MSRLDQQREIDAADPTPAHQIFRRDENATVVSRATARATAQAIQRFALRLERFARCVCRDAGHVWLRYATSAHEANAVFHQPGGGHPTTLTTASKFMYSQGCSRP